MAGCAILILAAGASSRMRGGDKLLEQVAGQPLLQLMLRRAMAVASGPVLCTLPAADHPRMTCLAGLEVIPVIVPDAAEGMGASIRAGVSALPAGCDAVMILPADLPDLDETDLSTMLAAHEATPAAILRARDSQGQAGHPVIFPAALFPDLARCHGDSGARDLLREQATCVLMVDLPDTHATTDLDTPEAWAAWRAGNS
ncbi:MAG: nucleotidyltransferase family protein [Paracoccaceae bacterium]|uniref:nucleotidyltransferase family protein n=1 Tax=Seohaeicola saemankumensis TaxID=481181 RepID=UPI001E2C7703|nr:nucleotidyltransferase family protein [Seohaeicola saemankumensis]MCD1624576.1 nucleotidyltransferase family protein [Seohaeicola saemankumensis]